MTVSTRVASSPASIRHHHPAVHVRSLTAVEAFTTKDGSTIRELQHTDAQSLAEASLEPGQATERRYHRASEEI